MALKRNRDRADRARSTGIGCAGHTPTARSTARRRRSGLARQACWCDAAAPSCAPPLDEFLAERMPDVLEQFGIARRLAHLHRIARSRKIHLEHVLDPARTRREQDDAVGKGQRLAEVMG